MAEAGTRSSFGRSARREPWRVVADEEWPRTATSTHNARYFDGADGARVAYAHLALSQAAGERRLDRISLDFRDAESGRYLTLIESRRLRPPAPGPA